MRSGDGLLPGQAQAATHRGSVAVVAGAGTGKTHMLAHRYLFHLEQGWDPLEIVAVTFTERAAAELRARIRTLVTLALPERPDAVVTLEAAQISTLHALAARICRDHPEAAGVPADFSVLDELEGQLWLAERLDEALAALPPAVFGELAYDDVRDALAALLRDPVTAQAAFEQDPASWPERVALWRAQALEELTNDPAWREAATLVRSVSGEDGDKAERARRHAEAGLSALARGEAEAALEAFDGVKLQGGRQAAWPEGELARLKGAMRLLRERLRSAQREGALTLALGPADARLAALLPHLRGAFASVRAALTDEKRRRRVLDFADLETHALRALDDPAVRAHYAARWKALLVDEYQDTSPVQERLLDRLAEGSTVTVVGDEKQSIYGFRGADAEVFRRRRARLRATDGDDSEVVMRRSFRAHRALTDGLNGVFAAVLGELSQDLRAEREAAPGEGPYLSLHTVDGEGSRAALQVSEARLIASLIRAMLDAGTLVWDKEAGAHRPVRPDDVAVLTRTWQPLAVYGEILPALGVPAVHSGGGNLLDTREAKDAIAMLRFLADPRDDVALAAVLRSPFFAVDDATLYRFAQPLPEAPPPGGARAGDDGDAGARAGIAAGGPERGRAAASRGRMSWWTALQASGRPAPELAGPRRVLLALLAARSWPPSRRLQLADELCGYSAVLSALPGGPRRLADLAGFLEFVRTLETGPRDTFSVVRRLRRLLRAGVEVPRPVLQAEGAVDLLTIHRSKGLEWPVVVVADLARASRGGGARMLFRRDMGVALRLQDTFGGTTDPALYTMLRRDRRRREEDEARRLLYVALTRARDRLALTAAAGRGGGLDLLMPGLEAAGVQPERVPHDPAMAVYPPPPQPEAAFEELDEVELPAGALGDAASGLEPRRPRPGDALPGGGASSGGASRAAAEEASSAASGGGAAAGWARARAVVGAGDETWLPFARALEEAGVAPPDLELAGRELTDGGRVTGHLSVMGWKRDGRPLAVVDAATPARPFDVDIVRIDPSTDLAAEVRRLRDALR